VRSRDPLVTSRAESAPLLSVMLRNKLVRDDVNTGMAGASDLIRVLAEPDARRDPGTAYASLRQHRPVFWHEGLRTLLVSRYQEGSEYSAIAKTTTSPSTGTISTDSLGRATMTTPRYSGNCRPSRTCSP
jgi:hypothetical protein